MADRLAFPEFVEAMLESWPDAERDVAAIELLTEVAAQLTHLVGSRAAAAVIYSVADLAATRHVEGVKP